MAMIARALRDVLLWIIRLPYFVTGVIGMALADWRRERRAKKHEH